MMLAMPNGTMSGGSPSAPLAMTTASPSSTGPIGHGIDMAKPSICLVLNAASAAGGAIGEMRRSVAVSSPARFASSSGKPCRIEPMASTAMVRPLSARMRSLSGAFGSKFGTRSLRRMICTTGRSSGLAIDRSRCPFAAARVCTTVEASAKSALPEMTALVAPGPAITSPFTLRPFLA